MDSRPNGQGRGSTRAQEWLQRQEAVKALQDRGVSTTGPVSSRVTTGAISIIAAGWLMIVRS